MTYFAYNIPTRADVVGPYSPLPRRSRSTWINRPVIAVSVAGLAVFAHCGLPLIIA